VRVQGIGVLCHHGEPKPVGDTNRSRTEAASSYQPNPKYDKCDFVNSYFLSTHADRQGVDISFTVCLFVLCVCVCLYDY